LVAQRNVRPERPDVGDAPHLSDAIWKLAQTCWVKDPTKRPTASAVCRTLSQLHDSISISRPKPKPSHTVFQPNSPLPSTLQTNVTFRGHTAEVKPRFIVPHSQPILNTSSLVLLIVQSGFEMRGNPVLRLEMHTDVVVCVAFSSSGRRIASGSRDNTVCVCDAMAGHAIGCRTPQRAHHVCLFLPRR